MRIDDKNSFPLRSDSPEAEPEIGVLLKWLIGKYSQERANKGSKKGQEGKAKQEDSRVKFHIEKKQLVFFIP